MGLESFINDFVSLNEPFVIINGSLFTFSDKKKDNFLIYNHKVYGLEESERVIELENKVYLRNASCINRLLLSEQSVTSLSSKNNSCLSSESEQNFIHRVFSEFDNLYNPPANLSDKTNDVGFVNFDNFKRTISLCENIFGDMLFLEGSFYKLRPSSSNSKNKVRFESKDYSFNSLKGSKNLIDLYNNSLLNHISNKPIKPIISESNKSNPNSLNSLIHKLRSSKTTKRSRDIGFLDEGDKQYVIYLDIPNFEVQKNGSRYEFDAFRIGQKISFDYSGVFIREPTVLTKNYFHPFVWKTGSICFNNDNRWEEYGIEFRKHFFNESDISKLPKKIAVCLDETRDLLKNGFIGSPSYVNNLTPEVFNREYLGEAMVEASKGVYVLGAKNG